MGEEQGPKFYNMLFSKSKEYNKHYSKSVMFPVFQQAMKMVQEIKREIQSDPCIIELGCGSGQFAHYLVDKKFSRYTGFDFCERALSIARKNSNQEFILKDCRDKFMFDKPVDIVIALEVLEHIQDDLAILSNVPSKTSIICSLPTFISKSHVRCFPTENSILTRYNSFLRINSVVRIDRWFVFRGYKE